MLGESTLTVQIGTHTFFNATNGADHIDFNDPVVRQNLEKLAALIQDVEEKTGHKFDADITISGKYGYMMAPGAEGDAGRLSVGTYGWAEGNLALTEGLLYHEMGHHASKNVLYVQTIAVNASTNNMLDSMEHFVRTDPQRAQGWMIETFGSIENAQAFVARLQPLIDSNTLAIQPILGKTDAELFEALKANPSLLEDVAGALDTEASTRLMTDEDLNLMGRMMDLQMQDKVLRAKNLAVIGAVSNDETAPFIKEFIDGHELRDFPHHTPDTKFTDLVDMLKPYRDNVTPAGHALAAAQRAEEYMADRYAFQHVSDPEAYMRSLKDLEHAEVEGRKAFAQVQAATGFDAATHPTIDDRVARGREFVAGGRAQSLADGVRSSASNSIDAPREIIARGGNLITDTGDTAKFMPTPARPAPANDVVHVPSGETPLVRVPSGAEDAARIRAGSIRGEHIKGGLLAAGIGAAVRGGVALVNDADGATVAEQAGRGILDAAIPGAGDGFSGITGSDKNRPVNWVDRGLNVLDTGTGAVATGGVVAAPASEGASLVPAAVAGVANLAVNLAHDATYAAGLSKEGGIITGGKNIITTVTAAVQARAEHNQAKADIPQPVVEQFIAAMANAHGTTTNPALNNYFQVRDLALMEHRDGIVQSSTSIARFGNLPRTPLSEDAMLARMDDAARHYLASGGTLELAQAALGQNAAQTQSAVLIQNLINVVPTRRTEGAVYPTANPQLEQLKTLKQQLENHPDQAQALAPQMATLAAAYLNTGNTVRDALTSYYHFAPFAVDTATIAQAEKDPTLLRAYDGADGSKVNGKITPTEIAAGMLKRGVYNSKVDSDHSGDLGYTEWKTATRTPSEFQSDKPSAGRK